MTGDTWYAGELDRDLQPYRLNGSVQVELWCRWLQTWLGPAVFDETVGCPLLRGLLQVPQRVRIAELAA